MLPSDIPLSRLKHLCIQCQVLHNICVIHNYALRSYSTYVFRHLKLYTLNVKPIVIDT